MRVCVIDDNISITGMFSKLFENDTVSQTSSISIPQPNQKNL